MPLPRPDESGGKEQRGRVLVIGGGRETPGAIVLAGTASLRAGAGKLQIATGDGNAPLVASLIPESRVVSIPETKTGAWGASAVKALREHAEGANALCVGPGMLENVWVGRFVKNLLNVRVKAKVVLDAGAINSLSEGREFLRSFEGRAVVTPNAEELAAVFGVCEERVAARPREYALRAAEKFGAVVVLKGRETHIADTDGASLVNRRGALGLGTSGSGDILAGIVAGLLARGASPLVASAWGVFVHALAGERLAKRVGRLGFLARELLPEIPLVMNDLDARTEDEDGKV